MNFIEADPLPDACKTCIEPECDVCEHGMERWLLSPEDEAAIKIKLFKQGLRRKNTAELKQLLAESMNSPNLDIPRIKAISDEMSTRGDDSARDVDVDAAWEDFATNRL